MKHFLLACMTATALCFSARANDSTATGPVFSDDQLAVIEKNLAHIFSMNNCGAATGAIECLRALKQNYPDYPFHRLLIPLMKTARDESGEKCSRILAILALHEMDSERANFVIKGIAQTTDDARVQYISKWIVFHQTVDHDKIPVLNVHQTTPELMVADE